MRWLRVAVVIAVMLVGAGCAKAVDGAAVPPPGTRPTATVMLTADGYGIQLGRPVARTSIEIFTEPQCSFCARLQMFHGGEIADYIDSGDLLVTYRPMAFFDTSATGYSHRVSNALFLAAAPEADVPAAGLQGFVQQLYWDADPSSGNEYLGTIAANARLPQQVIDRIASGDTALDTAAMDAANQNRLNVIRHTIAAPIVYDVNAGHVVDTTDNDWLNRLIGN